METAICIYCRRALDLNQLLEKAGKYRCKDENDCLEYQSREDSDDSVEDADYVSAMVKSSLTEAGKRIAAYKTKKADPNKSNEGEDAPISEQSIAEFIWMKSVVDGFALECQENDKFIFRYDETKGNEYEIFFNDAGRELNFAVRIDHAGAGYSLIVVRGEMDAPKDRLYEEFIYKSYPNNRREDLIQDLSVILVLFKEEQGSLSPLLNAFRVEIESRS